ncbi:CYFA0S02e07800g1_1 [Cyberlindnera fabianii]|uniref:CYFA0S02e07800g1_1 n=1 Tax=Cyberlindnera fabianii TaxID=36022 RepID=A0A061AU36_CYBFA|nr:hypothetical protein BON22_0005 [Cyberlindnera fabianii]CDR38881.1 CYFA0S02e07800g1_1 [Cyberlindnera fabianii]
MLTHLRLRVPQISVARAFSVSAGLRAPGDDLARQAEQRERALTKEAARKNELRKMARKRAEARSNPEKSPFFQDIPTALRYLRAAEVGRSPEDAVISITTGVVSTKGTAKLAGSVMFPKPLKETKILVFTSNPEQADAAKASGAKLVGGVELIEQIKNGELQLDFDRAFATPEITSQLNSIARTLGPRGLMPTAKKGTVSEDVQSLIKQVSGSIPFRQKTEQISIAVGRVNFTDSEIVQNIIAAHGALEQAISQQKSKRPSILGQTVLQSTHGPGLVINLK